MDFFREHLLSIITYTPLVGALLLLLPPFKKNDDAVRWFANAVGLVGFLVSLPLWFWFDRPGRRLPVRGDARPGSRRSASRTTSASTASARS